MPSGAWTVPAPLPPPIHDPVKLAETVAGALVEGGGKLKTRSNIGAVSNEDRKRLMRITGVTVEEFNAQISAKLGEIGDQVLDKIKAKLAADQFKTSELAFLYSVMHDKRLSVDGKAAVTNAAINIQINNNGTTLSKEDLIAALEGRKASMPAQDQAPVDVVTEPARKVG